MTWFNRTDRNEQDVVRKSAPPSGSVSHPVASAFRSKRQRPSFYADPVSWLVLEAFERALEECGHDLTHLPKEIGFITISDSCTLQTMREIGTTLEQGQISPLKFSGANPGSIGSLPSHFFGFTGPTLVLSMPPEEGLSIATTIAASWLRDGTAKFVTVSNHWIAGDEHRVESTIFSNAEEAAAWLV